MELLGRHYKDYSARQSSKFEKKSQLSDDELSRVSMIYSMHREEHGYYPQGIDTNGHLMWGIALKSDLQMLMENKGNEYERRGREIMANPGCFSEMMEEKRIEEFNE